jgi:serine/threonine protein kinase
MPDIAGQTLLPGERLGDFELVQVIGLTSFGVLYLARQLDDGRTVAIKEYMPSTLAVRLEGGQVEVTDPSHELAYQRGLQAFLTEALTLSQFDHPNLLPVSSIWEDNGTAYRVMPYLSGATLLAWRTALGEPASQAQLQALLDGLLGALFTLNQSGLAHGQVEPLNIYLDEAGQPLLMDFDAVHQAVQSDLRKPYIDTYADPARMPEVAAADLHAVAAVLHFAISGEWAPPRPGQAKHHAPLADVLLRFKNSASALEYQPEFLAAIDTALALPADERPATITEFRALFDARPGVAVVPEPPFEPAAPSLPRSRRKREPIPTPPPAFPLNSSESVLALLANFDRGPAPAAEDVEPFQAPEVPTLTEEAEPSVAPLLVDPFEDLEGRDAMPLPLLMAEEPAAFEPLPYAPMPRIRPRNPWRQRLVVIAGTAAVVIAALGALAWQFGLITLG